MMPPFLDWVVRISPLSRLLVGKALRVRIECVQMDHKYLELQSILWFDSRNMMEALELEASKRLQGAQAVKKTCSLVSHTGSSLL
jgi:hypothetical protein